MFANSRYLQWARRYYGRVPFDLAASGIPAVPREELGMPPRLDDVRAWEGLGAAIAAYNDVSTAEVIPALGTSHGVFLAYVACTQPGDDVLVEDPTYEPLWRTAEGLGLNVHRFPRALEDGFDVDIDVVLRAMTARTRLVVVSNLHNPSGTRLRDRKVRELAQAVGRQGAMLLVDEVYAPFDKLTDEGGVFRGSSRKLGSNVLSVGSLTKCYGLGHERVGWLLGPPGVIERASHGLLSNLGHFPLSYANLAVHAFSRVGWLSERARTHLANQRAKVEKWVSRHRDLHWSAPDEGVFGFAWRKDPFDLTPVIERGVEDKGVLVAAGRFFGIPQGFRLSWAIGGPTLDEGLRRLDEVLDGAH